MAGHGSNAPTIIKRKKVVAAGGHHGGAWKVAYADFVTAMMAFFLLMWLLNATTEKQRKGIADYFDPTVPITRVSGGGDDSFSGDSLYSEDTLAQDGLGGTIEIPSTDGNSGGDSAASENSHALQGAAFDEIHRLVGSGGESMISKEVQRHVVTRQTDEGLIVELFDLPGEPLFALDGVEPTPLMTGLSEVLVEIFALATNDIAVSGHVRTEPIVRVGPSAWELSSARADRTRELLGTAGLGERRIVRVTGFADRKPAAANPLAVRNNRIEIILLREKF